MTRPSPTVSLETTYKEGYCRLPIPVVAAHVGDERGGEGGEQSGAGQGGRRAVGQDGGGDQGRAGQQHRGDGRGDLPVVADDEVVPEAGEALDAPEEGRGRTRGRAHVTPPPGPWSPAPPPAPVPCRAGRRGHAPARG